MRQLTKNLVREALRDDPWSIGNEVLYDLCRRYPRHETDAEIIAKVWLIGRAYSASVERGRGKAPDAALSNDRFYAESVPNALRSSRLDRMLAGLRRVSGVNEDTAGAVLEVHAHLVDVLCTLTGKEKRSLASKYLHFHRPDLFFIYDSRAMTAVRKLGIKPAAINVPENADRPYARFVTAAIALRAHVFRRFGTRLTARQVDRLLLVIEAAR